LNGILKGILNGELGMGILNGAFVRVFEKRGILKGGFERGF